MRHFGLEGGGGEEAALHCLGGRYEKNHCKYHRAWLISSSA